MAEYIKREPILKFIEDGLNNPDKSKAFGHDAIEIMTEVQYAPAADVVEVKHGQWDGEGDGYADGEIVIDVWYCSECGHCIDEGIDDPCILPNYYPNCGAKMTKENENG